MAVFASKLAFEQLGLDYITPSLNLSPQTCHICTDPLDVTLHPHSHEGATPSNAHHAAVRIGVCGHLHGAECLAAWLESSNACPTCRRVLFEPCGSAVRQVDVSGVVNVLGRRVGVGRVLLAVARVVEGWERERERERERESRVCEELGVEGRDGLDDVMDDGEWVESGSEDFDGSEDGDDQESWSPTG